jgi:hypothetical protein
VSLPGPFLAGQRLTAGQLNDATQKTLKSISISAAGVINTTAGTTELNIPKLALGPIPQVNGGLYRFEPRLIVQNSVGTDDFELRLRRDTALTGTIVKSWFLYGPQHVGVHHWQIWADIPATVTEDVNYFVSLRRTAGTGTLSLYGQVGSSDASGIAAVRSGYSSEFAVIP